MIDLRAAPRHRPLVTALLLGLGLSPPALLTLTQAALPDHGRPFAARSCMRHPALSSMNDSTVSGDCAITGASGREDNRWGGEAVAGAATLPAGCHIVSGNGLVTSSGQTLTISQSSAMLTIDCSAFHVGVNAAVVFDQTMGSDSIVIVRISDPTPSQILGAIAASGRVFLVNPNGIVFGARSQVHAQGLVASSLDIGDADVIAGTLKFGNNGDSGLVRNQGCIATPAGGQVYLIAAQVENTGSITAPNGKVLLTAGRNVQLTGDLKAQVVTGAPTDQASNLGSVVALGGKIGIFGTLVKQSGVVNADSAAFGAIGEVVMKAARTTALAGGSQTSARGTDVGGTIALLGANVHLLDTASVDASGGSGGGTVWIGGGFHGADAALQDAQTTYVGANARIRADALHTGNGGQIAVWSNVQTAMYARISARGGTSGGNGGYVETSGRNKLGFGGKVDLTATNGATGNLLLDPYTITIDDTGSAPITPTGSNPVSYISGVDSDVTAASINSQLASANVIVQAGASGGGSVTVISNNLNWNTNNTLTLAATADVNINGSILGQSGNLELIATSGNITQTAPVNVGSLSAEAGGDVTLTNVGNIVGTLAGTSGGSNGFNFSTNDNITIGSVAGNQGTVTGITATGTGGVGFNAGGSASTSSASITGPSLTITSGSGVGQVFNPLSTAVGALTITNGAATGGGDIVVSNSGAVALSKITQMSSGSLGRIYISDNNALTVGSGGITQNNGHPGAEVGLVASAGLAIDGPILNGAYTVGLSTSSGDITVGGSGYLQAAALSLNAPSGNVTLGSSNNAIGVVAGTSSGNFLVNDNVGTEVVGTVTLANNTFIGQQSGITSTSGDIALQNTGSMYLANPLGVSTITGNVGLSATGGYIHQASGGTIGAAGLSAYAFGDVALTASNSVGTLAGQSGSGIIGGNFVFTTTGALAVGSVTAAGGLIPGQTGITANNNFSVGLTAAQNITIGANVNSGTNTTTLTSNSGAITQTAAIHAGTLSGSSNGSTTLTNAGNTVNTLGSFSSAAFSLNDSTAIALGNSFALNFGSAPSSGQMFTLVTAPSVNGTLTPTTVTGLSAGQSANFSYPAGQVILTINGLATPVRLQEFEVK